MLKYTTNLVPYGFSIIRQFCSAKNRMFLYYMGLVETLEAETLYLEKVWDTIRASMIKAWLLLHLWEVTIWKPIWLSCNMIYGSITNSQHLVTGENSPPTHLLRICIQLPASFLSVSLCTLVKWQRQKNIWILWDVQSNHKRSTFQTQLAI